MSTPEDILKRIRHIELRTRRLVTASFAGQYQSVFKGQGMNFEEVRQYTPGDEIRAIDWNVTARTNVPHVKIFTEEREMTVMVALDVSTSGAYGSVELSKREVAAEVAAVLAFSAIHNNDKVGLLLFSDRVELYVPPKKGRQHALRLIREMLYFEPQGHSTDIAGALRHLNNMLTRRAVVFLISDFIETRAFGVGDAIQPIQSIQSMQSTLINSIESSASSASTKSQSPRAAGAEPYPAFAQALVPAARRHDLIALPITDPGEETLPDVGLVTFEDAETGEIVEIDTGRRAARAAFLGTAKERRKSLEKLFASRNVDVVPLSTDADPIPALHEFFRNRERRRA